MQVGNSSKLCRFGDRNYSMVHEGGKETRRGRRETLDDRKKSRFYERLCRTLLLVTREKWHAVGWQREREREREREGGWTKRRKRRGSRFRSVTGCVAVVKLGLFMRPSSVASCSRTTETWQRDVVTPSCLPCALTTLIVRLCSSW